MLRSFKQDPSWKHEAPPMPRWKLEQDLGRARALYTSALVPWLDRELTPQSRQILAQDLVGAVRDGPGAAELALADSLLAESALPLTPRVARRLALQIVCNPAAMVAGIPIPKFMSVTQKNTWVPLEITSIEDSQQERAKGLRKQINMLVIGGEYAGFEVSKTCPCGYLSHLAYDLGYSFRRPYEDQDDLVGLWLAGFIEPSNGFELKFDKYWLNSAMSKRNSALVKARRWTEQEQLEGTQATKEAQEDDDA